MIICYELCLFFNYTNTDALTAIPQLSDDRRFKKITKLDKMIIINYCCHLDKDHLKHEASALAAKLFCTQRARLKKRVTAGKNAADLKKGGMLNDRNKKFSPNIEN